MSDADLTAWLRTAVPELTDVHDRIANLPLHKQKTNRTQTFSLTGDESQTSLDSITISIISENDGA